MPYLLRLAQKAGDGRLPLRVRVRAGMRYGAIRDFSDRIGSKVFLDLPEASPEEVFRSYARDHLHD